MSYNDKPWDNPRNAEFKEPHNLHRMPQFNDGNMQNSHNPHNRPPPPRQQFQTYSNRPEPPFTHVPNNLYMPRHSQFQNRPPPLPQSPVTFSNPSSFPNFSVPPPIRNVIGNGQHVSSENAQSTLPNLRMNSGPIPMHGSYQQMSNHPPFPQSFPHRLPVDHLHHSESYKTVTQPEGVSDSLMKAQGNKQEIGSSIEIGAQKLEKWLQIVGKFKRPQMKGPSKVKPSVQLWKSLNQLSVLSQVISNMTSKLKEMTDSTSSANIVTWRTMTNSLEELKNQCVSLEPVLTDPSVKNMERKLSQVQHKRARLRQARVHKFEEEQTLKESWVKKSQQIDKWQERHRAKIKEENLRKSRKAAADCTLSKVSREIQDATRLIETMLALQKLRLIRRDAAQKRGDTDLGESRQTFEQKISDMTRLVQSQLEYYKEEEAKLKQVIKSEQEENTEKERLLQIEREKQKQKEDDEELQTMLFGPQEVITESHPRFPYVQYYRQAESNLQSFLQIRHDWDSFLVPESTLTSSVIPSSWIFPASPNSATWATALK